MNRILKISGSQPFFFRGPFSVSKNTRLTKPLIQISNIIKCFFININNKAKLSMIKLILMSEKNMKSLFTRHLTKLEGCSTGDRLYKFKLITDSLAQMKHYKQHVCGLAFASVSCCKS